MYSTKFLEADWLSRWQFQRQFYKTQAISDSKLGRNWKVSVIGQLRRDRILSQSKYRIWASLGGNFLFCVRFVVLFLVAKWLKSKDFIVQTLNILKVSSTQVRIKNTKDSTRNWLKQFEKWAVERKKEVNLEKYAAEELNSTLYEFFAELRKAHGDDYELDV